MFRVYNTLALVWNLKSKLTINFDYIPEDLQFFDHTGNNLSQNPI